MSFDVATVATRVIVNGRDLIGIGINWMGHQVSAGVGHTGLYQTGFWKTVAGLWAKISPTLSSASTYMTTTGFGLSILLGGTTILCGISCYNAWGNNPHGEIHFVKGIFMAIMTLFFATLTLTAFSYGGAIIV